MNGQGQRKHIFPTRQSFDTVKPPSRVKHTLQSSTPAPHSTQETFVRIYARRLLCFVKKWVGKLPYQNSKRWRLAYFSLLFFGLIAIPIGIIIHSHLQAQRYTLSVATKKLVGDPVTALDKQLSYDVKSKSFQYNPGAVNGLQDVGTKLTVGGSKYYGVSLASVAKQGQTYTDAQTKLSFSLVPQFGQLNGKHVSGHIVYPFDQGQVVYTLKTNGLKEDAVISRPVDRLNLSYKLVLPSSLEARLLPNGSVGIYSGDPALFGNISYGSSGDQQAIQKARENGVKNNLVFLIPAPVIIQSGTTATGGQAKFSLSGNRLTVNATALSHLSYPISIDPSVVINSANTFSQGNNEDNNLSIGSSIARSSLSGGTIGTYATTNAFTTPAFQISVVVLNGYMYEFTGQVAGAGSVATTQYAPVCTGTNIPVSGCTVGAVGTWTSTNSFSTARSNFGAVAYNGYLYIIGGVASGGGSIFSDVQYAKPSSTGSIPASGAGAWTTNANSLVNGRWAGGYAAYNGYMYVVGGCGQVVAGCSSVKNDVQYAKINADGTVGVWHYTFNSADTGTTSSGGFSTGRKQFGFAAYNGFIYVMGGCNTNCSISQSDVQYAPLNKDGTVGTWATNTISLPSTRHQMAAEISSGYLYITGGNASGLKNDTLYAPVYANGTIGAWNSSNTFTTARFQHASTIYNGYLYVVGGCSNTSTNCDAPSGELNDVQYAKINDVGPVGIYGSPGSGNTLSSTLYGPAVVATGGYIYLFGGSDNAANGSNVIQYTSVNTDGTLGAWANMSTGSGPTIAGARLGASAAAYNGYIYVSGGRTTSAGTVCSDIQFAKINPANGTFSTAWTDAFTGGAAACTNADMLNGQPGNFAGRQNHQMLAYNNYLYIIGGITNNNTNTLADVQFVPINSNGTLGAIHYTHASTDDTTVYVSGLGTARNSFGAVISNGYIYVFGGKTTANNNTGTSSIEAAQIQSNGTVGSWNGTTAGTMPGGIGRHMFAFGLSNGMLYVSGGIHNTNDTACTNGAADILCNDTWYVPICNGTNNTGGCSTGTAGVLGTWVQTNYFTTARGNPQGAIYNGYFYVMGGGTGNTAQFVCTSGLGGCTMQTDVQYTPLNNGGGGGDLGWSSTSSMVTTHRNMASVVYNGYLYALGGSGTGPGNDVQFAPINADGTVGTWQYTFNSTASATNPSNLGFTGARVGFPAFVYNGYMYILGGRVSGTDSSDVQYAPINSNGTVGTWQATTSFHVGRYEHIGFVYNGYMYAIGGFHNTASTACSIASSLVCTDVQFAPINADGTVGAWHYTHNSADDGTSFVADDLPYGLFNATGFAYNGYMYALGGHDGTNYRNNIYAHINSNGTVGTWQNTSPFSTPRTQAAVSVANGYVYVSGGLDSSSTDLSDVQYASIYSDGALEAWRSTGSFAVARTELQTQIYNGYLYVMGGYDGTSARSDVVYTPLASLPRVAHYSRLVDLKSTMGANTGGDAEITRYGLTFSSNANLVGHRAIKLCASGATANAASGNNVFGTATCNSGLLFSNTPSSFKSYGRYGFVVITIDDSLGATFPDSSPGTISELDTYFHASPARRLRGGQTFVDSNDGTSNTRNQLDTEGAP